MRRLKGLHILGVTIPALAAATGAVCGRTDVWPGFDLFTVAGGR